MVRPIVAQTVGNKRENASGPRWHNEIQSDARTYRKLISGRSDSKHPSLIKRKFVFRKPKTIDGKELHAYQLSDTGVTALVETSLYDKSGEFFEKLVSEINLGATLIQVSIENRKIATWIVEAMFDLMLAQLARRIDLVKSELYQYSIWLQKNHPEIPLDKALKIYEIENSQKDDVMFNIQRQFPKVFEIIKEAERNNDI